MVRPEQRAFGRAPPERTSGPYKKANNPQNITTAALALANVPGASTSLGLPIKMHFGTDGPARFHGRTTNLIFQDRARLAANLTVSSAFLLLHGHPGPTWLRCAVVRAVAGPTSATSKQDRRPRPAASRGRAPAFEVVHRSLVTRSR